MEILNNLSSAPWWVALSFMVLTTLLNFVTTRGKNKDDSQFKLVAQTVERQTNLDKRQDSFMDQLQEEISRVREEVLQVRKELAQERAGSLSLQSQLDILSIENRELKRLLAERAEELVEVSEESDNNDKLKKALEDFFNVDSN